LQQCEQSSAAKVAPVLCGRDVVRWLKIASPLPAAVLFATHAHAGGLFSTKWRRPISAPRRRRAAAADNAATAFGNPAGMTRLNQSQMLGIQPATASPLDKGNDTRVSGGNAATRWASSPRLGGYYVLQRHPDLKSACRWPPTSGPSARYQRNWAGRYYATSVLAPSTRGTGDESPQSPNSNWPFWAA